MSDPRTRAEQDRCPNAAEHTYGPAGYVQWHEWANEIRKTHTQHRCRGCGFWLIIRPKPTGGQS